MEKETFKKNGLIYTDDYKVVVGIDTGSSEFTGVVPNGVTGVEEEAFSCCSLKNIELPDSVTYVGANLFCNCTELESVKLPANLKTLSPFMFCGCKKLKNITMPDEVEDFTDGLFAECSSLEEIPFRGGIKTMPEGVVDGCSSIKTLVIPDSVTKICTGAISGCEKLETLVLPASLQELEPSWLSNCPALRHIRISDDNAFFRTDEDSHILYKVAGNSEIVELELENKSADSLPGFKEPDMEGSIISFDENEDETMDEPVFLNDEEKKMDEINETTVNAAADNGMDARLAEILGQNKMYDEGDFSIMDIPQATDEEINASVLESTASEEEKFDNEPVVQVNIPEQQKEASAEDMEAKLAEIMGQNTDSFSINDIPMASEEELSANKILDTSQDPVGEESVASDVGATEDGGISLDDVFNSDEEEESALPEPKTELNDDKAFMQNLFFETQKVEQQNTDVVSDEKRILFVFAENTIETELGKKFSPRLQKCCNRLAKVHGFTSVYYFNETRMDTEKFVNQLKEFMADKDVLIACEGDSLYSISENTTTMVECLGIPLSKENIETELQTAMDGSVKPLKLIVHDNLAE